MTQPKTITLADEKHGYEFGIDGLMSTKSVCDFLDVSRYTLYSLVEEGLIRKSKGRGDRCFFCRRSVMDYIRNTTSEV